MIVIYPRAHVEMKAIVRVDKKTDREIICGVVPSRVTINITPHTEAGSAELEFNQTALPFPAKSLRGAFVTIFMGLVDDPVNGDIRTPDNIRFVGYAVGREGSLKDGWGVRLKVTDLSLLLREESHLYTKEVVTATGKVKLDPYPRYTDTVRQAIERIYAWMDAASTVQGAKMVEVLPIADPSGLADTPLSSIVGKGKARGTIPVKPNASAWGVIDHMAGLASLMVRVDITKRETDGKTGVALLLQRPSDVLRGSSRSKYTFIVGDEDANVLEYTESRKFFQHRKGVKLIAYSPTLKKRIEAVYPPDSQLPPKTRPKPGAAKQATGHGSRGAPKARAAPPPPDRDVFPVGGDGITSPEQLQAMAERVWNERLYQESERSITTANWTKELFDLRPGDDVTVAVDPSLEASLRSINDRDAAVDFLVERLRVERDAAGVLYDLSRGEPEDHVYRVSSIHHEWSSDPESPAQSRFELVNLIDL